MVIDLIYLNVTLHKQKYGGMEFYELYHRINDSYCFLQYDIIHNKTH